LYCIYFAAFVIFVAALLSAANENFMTRITEQNSEQNFMEDALALQELNV